MNTDHTTRTDAATKKYVRDLEAWLQRRNVPGERIGEINAEVEVHVADSDQAATEAFGPAREYSKQFGLARPRTSKVRTVITTLIAGMAVTFAVINGVAWLVWFLIR